MEVKLSGSVGSVGSGGGDGDGDDDDDGDGEVVEKPTRTGRRVVSRRRRRRFFRVDIDDDYADASKTIDVDDIVAIPSDDST